jgi:hypothetical protein
MTANPSIESLGQLWAKLRRAHDRMAALNCWLILGRVRSRLEPLNRSAARELERDQFARIVAASDSDHDVLVTVEHIRHR